MEINIDAKEIQEAIVKSITETTIGEEIKKAISKVLFEEPIGYGRKSIIEEACKNEVQRMVSILIRQELDNRKEKICELIRPQISDDIILTMTSSALEFMINKCENG